jgi:hypothetical protein
MHLHSRQQVITTHLEWGLVSPTRFIIESAGLSLTIRFSENRPPPAEEAGHGTAGLTWARTGKDQALRAIQTPPTNPSPSSAYAPERAAASV